MRLITIRAPKGQGQKVAEIAFKSDIPRVSSFEAKALKADKTSELQDVVEVESATPKVKKFVEALMEAPFYDPLTFTFTIRHPESVFASESPEKETYPIVRPTTDVYEDLWQFSQITVSLVLRVFLSSLLLAYGMMEGYMPLIIAGLLFLPYHHQLLSMALGGVIGEWRLFRQGIYAFLVSTIAAVLAGVCVGLLTEAPVEFTEFLSPVLPSLLIAMVIGIAAGLGDVDDAGRRELIGLAATAHLTVYPVWFGLKFVFGFDPADKPIEHLLVFLMDIVTISIFAALTYKLMKMHGKGIKGFVKRMHKSRR